MKRDDVFVSNYLKVKDLRGGPKVLTIKDVVMESFTDDEGGDQNKAVVYFQEIEKGLILNQTNWDALEPQLGEDTDDWKGKKIRLKVSKITAFGKPSEGLRVSDEAVE